MKKQDKTADSGYTFVTQKANPKKFRFSVQALNKLDPRADGARYYVYATNCPSLAMVVSKQSKRFLCCKKIAGKIYRHPLGVWPTVPNQQDQALIAAKAAASRYNAAAVSGNDPFEQERQQKAEAERAGKTFKATFDEYIGRAEARPENPMRTANNFRSMRKCHLADWDSRKLSSFTKEEIKERHERLGAEKGRYCANRVVQLLRVLFNYAIEKQYLLTNPAKGFPLYKELPRRRSMSLPELICWRTALAQEDDEDVRDYFALCLLTAARRGNVAAMRFAEVNLDRAEWAIPGTKFKTGQETILPLHGQAIAILRRRLEKSDSEFVFPGRFSGHRLDFREAFQRVLKRAAQIEVRQWLEDHPGKTTEHFKLQRGEGLLSLHLLDIRRTVGTIALNAGASILEVAKMLGHSEGSIQTARAYAHVLAASTQRAMTNTVRFIDDNAAPLLEAVTE